MQRAKISFGKFLVLAIVSFGFYPMYYWVTRTEHIMDLIGRTEWQACGKIDAVQCNAPAGTGA